MYDEDGQRRQETQAIKEETHNDASDGVNPDRSEGGTGGASSFFAFLNPYNFFHRVWNKYRPFKAVEVAENDAGTSLSAAASTFPAFFNSYSFAFRNQQRLR